MFNKMMLDPCTVSKSVKFLNDDDNLKNIGCLSPAPPGFNADEICTQDQESLASWHIKKWYFFASFWAKNSIIGLKLILYQNIFILYFSKYGKNTPNFFDGESWPK